VVENNLRFAQRTIDEVSGSKVGFAKLLRDFTVYHYNTWLGLL
jgi:hypothetical protein